MANRTRLPKLWYVVLVAFAVALPTPLFAGDSPSRSGRSPAVCKPAIGHSASPGAGSLSPSSPPTPPLSDSEPSYGPHSKSFAAGAHYDLLSDAQVSDALTRLKLQAGAALSPDDVKHLGKEAAAALVLTGAITNGAGAVTISAALVHAASGEEAV